MANDVTLIERMTGWFGFDPAVKSPVPTATISAALWERDTQGLTEVCAAPNPTTHLVAVGLSNYTCDSFVEDRQITGGPWQSGRALIVAAGPRTRAVVSGPWRILHIYVPDALVRKLAGELAPSSFSGALELINPLGERDDFLEHCAALLLSEMRGGSEANQLVFDSIGVTIGMHLVRRWSNMRDRRPSELHHRGGLAPRVLKGVQAYMREQIERDVSLRELAALADLSAHHFCRAFKRSVGVPPHAWLMRQRVERAKEMMVSSPHMGLAEIALCVGYASQTTFGVAFRRATGLSPSQWRAHLSSSSRSL
jgi:AraC family transcriptional regulator